MSDTPETDHLEDQLGSAARFSHPIIWRHARQLERERDEAQEIECAAIESWWEENQRALREGQRVVEAREQNAKLREIAQWFADYFVDECYCSPVIQKAEQLRAELDRLK